MTTYVYFLRYGGAVKVGCSAYPTSRQVEVMLHRAALSECKLIGVVRGGFKKEKIAIVKMRELYGDPLIGREWFTVSESFDPRTIVSGNFLKESSIRRLRRKPPAKTRNLMSVPLEPKLRKELRAEWANGGKFWYGFIHDVLTAGLAVIRTRNRSAA